VVVTQQRWILAPNATVAGFEGKLKPQSIPTGPTSSHVATPATASHSSLSTTEVLVIAGLVVVVAGIGLLVLRRRRAHPTER
jgi:LPXTG-motif cell wall-anchored protein